MLILGIETATMTGGVALLSENKLVSEYDLSIRTTHTARLLPAIDQILKDSSVNKNEIDGIAISIGPGSFTGLRIGLAAAKGLALGLGIPLVGVPTLKALAGNIPFASYQICPILDAKKKEVYCSLFRYACSLPAPENDDGPLNPDQLVRLIPYQVVSPDNILKQIYEKTIFLGDAVDVYHDFIVERLGDLALFAPVAQRLPRAATVAEMGILKLKNGEYLDLLSSEPIYIRPSDAEISIDTRL